jgi:hypothetical protein
MFQYMFLNPFVGRRVDKDVGCSVEKKVVLIAEWMDI